ncbi:MAG TPA: porin [Candidatus Aphodousia faecigallinarum]|uniref:Porin n=1 Tax=Candidatus Aphodousia faecigallinarum TaxID=2840677 RepID=A0A9D1IIN9_9BURK|nr:porin [Candidatus Aphodousia faecigallinarum]
MKKTLAAVAVLGAFAGSAFAADVTMYGRIDTGLHYNNNQVDVDGQQIVDADKFEMGSGLSTGSRLGLKGTEEINEDLKAAFVLEHGFNSDDGGDSDSNRFFNRESSVQLISDTYGTLAFGRMGTIASDAGTFGFYAGAVNPFGSGWSAVGGQGVGAKISALNDGRYDNTITYKSPTFAGTTVYAQYSMKGDNFNADQKTYDENTHRVDRYAALGVNFATGALNLAAVVDWVDEACTGSNPVKEPEDKYTFNVGGSYDFGVMKAFLAAQYFQNANDVGLMGTLVNDSGVLGTSVVDGKEVANKFSADELKGYSVALGATVPAMGGNFLMSVSYTDAEDDAKDATAEFTGYQAAVAYQYPLSKRTVLYTGVGYTNREADKLNAVEGNKAEQETYDVSFGMVHYF